MLILWKGGKIFEWMFDFAGRKKQAIFLYLFNYQLMDYSVLGSKLKGLLFTNYLYKHGSLENVRHNQIAGHEIVVNYLTKRSLVCRAAVEDAVIFINYRETIHILTDSSLAWLVFHYDHKCAHTVNTQTSNTTSPVINHFENITY